MSKFAIIKVGPFQYNVEEGKEYQVPRFNAEEGKNFKISEVLAVGDEKSIIVGKPFVANATVDLDIVKQGKGEKITSKIFKAKSRYRRTRGHRILVTKFKVNKISTK